MLGYSPPLVLRAGAALCDHDDVVSAIATADPWIGSKGLASGSWDGTVKVNFNFFIPFRLLNLLLLFSPNLL